MGSGGWAGRTVWQGRLAGWEGGQAVLAGLSAGNPPGKSSSRRQVLVSHNVEKALWLTHTACFYNATFFIIIFPLKTSQGNFALTEF